MLLFLLPLLTLLPTNLGKFNGFFASFSRKAHHYLVYMLHKVPKWMGIDILHLVHL